MYVLVIYYKHYSVKRYNIMSGIVGSYINHRGSGIVSKLGTDAYQVTSTGTGTKTAIEQLAAAGIANDAVTLAKMASGTDGNIISYDTSGNPVAVATGSDGQVLTSSGAGAVCAFEAAASGGITQASMWRVTASFTSTGADPIASNWEEDDQDTGTIVGSSMTESSGVFTFPATGVWWVTFQVSGYDDADSSANSMTIKGTDDDFTSTVNLSISYSFIEGGNSNDPGGNAHFGNSCETIFDVDDTSNCKVKFKVATYASASVTWNGSSTTQNIGAPFIRLGDT